MDNGEWRMENGEWTMENGKWTMENGQVRASRSSGKKERSRTTLLPAPSLYRSYNWLGLYQVNANIR